MKSFSTPMMKQYEEIKKQYADCLLFYRMGDFYELFLEDALIGSKVLNITLTHKRGGKDGNIPMAGIPFHAVDIYLTKLVKEGYKVAVCEQLSPPNKRGLVKRDVIRIVTPGTMLDEKALEKKENNYIISLSLADDVLALAIADISTGYFAVRKTSFEKLATTLANELSRLQPAECILSYNLYNDVGLLRLLKRQQNLNIYCFQEWEATSEKAKQILRQHFNVHNLASFGLEDDFLLQEVSASLIGYLQQTQKTKVVHIRTIEHLLDKEYVQLDRSTILNLELFSTIREHNLKGSLLSVLDQTTTSMGGRLLRQWVKAPLYNQNKIVQRHDAVEELLLNKVLRAKIQAELKEITDIERLLSRLSVRIGNARDLINLKNSLNTIFNIKSQLKKTKAPLLKNIEKLIDEDLSLLIPFVETHIMPEPPIDLRSGRMIQRKVNNDLDEWHRIIDASRKWISDYEQSERERTGISSLKVRFNSVFGYYIEVSKSNLHAIPDNYFRKQTLVNGERFTTPELKKQETIILSAEEKMCDLEYSLFWQILEKVLSYTSIIQQAAKQIAMLDCLINFADLAEQRQYVRANFSEQEFNITAGRHPVVETLLVDQRFCPNDVNLGANLPALWVITGPNMAGKSVFIRQVALIVLMNQIGSFVPASKATLTLVDRIFVRSGAADVISEGLSTFMVEMTETAYILRQASEKSLIVMDEIGRGTSTYDGISIASAVAEFLVTNFNLPPKTLFATHYHELQQLAEKYPSKIANHYMATEEQPDGPLFLHTILSGSASHSFGIAVAKLAGVPAQVIEKANNILQTLEEKNNQPPVVRYSAKSNSIVEHLIGKELESIDISQMTPLEALNKLAELKEQMRIFNSEKKREFLENADD